MRITTILLVILTLPLVTSLGVTPASTDVLDEEAQITIHAVNDAQRTLEATVRVEGNASEFINLDVQQVQLSPTRLRAPIAFTINTPADAQPGTYTGSIVIEEQQTNNPRGGVVEALPAVRHRVTITIPQTGKHLRTRLLLSTTAANSPIHVTLAAENIGTQNINELQSTIEVRDASGALLEELDTQTTSLRRAEKKNLVATWTPPNPGPYQLTATTRFDEQEQTTQLDVDVGELDLHVGEPAISDFSFGEVAQITLPVTSTWNDELRGVYVRVRVYDEEDRRVDTITSPSTDLAALGSAELSAFWETQEVEEGAYRAEATLHFGGRQRTVDFWITDAREEQPSTNYRRYAPWISILLALLALIAYLRITYINKQRSQKDKVSEE